MEANQKVPPFLAALQSDQDQFLRAGDDVGCAYCGGLGHRITNCPKLEAVNHKKNADIGRKDYLARGGMDE